MSVHLICIRWGRGKKGGQEDVGGGRGVQVRDSGARAVVPAVDREGLPNLTSFGWKWTEGADGPHVGNEEPERMKDASYFPRTVTGR